MKQITLDFDAALTQRYPAIMDVIRAAAYNCGKPLKTVAADMDLGQSELSRKLAENPNDPRELNVRELPAFIKSTGRPGHDVIYWLIETFIEDPATRRERALDMLTDLAPRLEALLREASGDAAKAKSLVSVK